MVRRHHKLRIGWFHQHLTEQLDLDLTPIQFMQKQFPAETEVEAVRRIIGTIPLKLAVTNTSHRTLRYYWKGPNYAYLYTF